MTLLATGCASISVQTPSSVPLVAQVDLPRFMGDWYLIAHIPTERDRAAHNAVENYQLNPDGSIATTYTNRLGGFDGKRKRMTPTAYVMPDSNNALWGMRFLLPGTSLPWPPLYEYRVAHLEPDYSVMIVGRSKLDYLWLFARRPEMDEPTLEGYRRLIAEWGYDPALLLRVPQKWPQDADTE